MTETADKASLKNKHLRNADYFEENRGRNWHNVEWFLYAYYISAGQTSLLQVLNENFTLERDFYVTHFCNSVFSSFYM